MRYKDSKQFLKTLKKARRILINVHRSPDPDGLGSALAFYTFLKSNKKEVKIICPSELTEENLFLPNAQFVEKVDFKKFDFSEWDVFLVLDSANWGMVDGGKNTTRPKVTILSIDHHITSEKFGDLNIIDSNVSSTCELIYLLFREWKVSFSKEIYQNLLAGIICDTGIFQYPNASSQTLEVTKSLIDMGASKDEIVANVYRNYSFSTLKLWSKILEKMVFDEENKFVYSAIPLSIYKKFNRPLSAKETAASMFCPVVKGADFGMVMVEQEEKKLSVSFRSKKDFDVSKIAKSLGGGGHKLASGVTIKGENFQDAVKIVLDATVKYVQESKKNC